MVMQTHVDLLEAEVTIDMEVHHLHQDHCSVDLHQDIREVQAVVCQCQVGVIQATQDRVDSINNGDGTIIRTYMLSRSSTNNQVSKTSKQGEVAGHHFKGKDIA